MDTLETRRQNVKKNREPIALGAVTELTGAWWFWESWDAAFYCWCEPLV